MADQERAGRSEDMRFIYERGRGRRRVMHLCGYDALTGEPSMRALCGIGHPFNTTSNVPLGRPTCKNCLREARRG